jgi:hypothetical protein
MDIKEEFTDIYGGRKKVRLNKKEKVLIKLIKTELTKKIIGGETIADYINTKIENSKYHKFTHKYTNYEICKIIRCLSLLREKFNKYPRYNIKISLLNEIIKTILLISNIIDIIIKLDSLNIEKEQIIFLNCPNIHNIFEELINMQDKIIKMVKEKIFYGSKIMYDDIDDYYNGIIRNSRNDKTEETFIDALQLNFKSTDSDGNSRESRLIIFF